MQYPIPQFVDVEDQVIGPLTVKQFFFLLAGGIFLLIAWSFVDVGLFIFIAVITAAIVVPLAFVKPFGRPLPAYLASMLQYIMKPKIRLWAKDTKASKIKIYIKPKQEPVPAIPDEPKFKKSKIQQLAKTLDFKTTMPTQEEKWEEKKTK